MAGLKIKYVGNTLAVLLIDAPPSMYGIVKWIICSLFGKRSWNVVINIKQVLIAKKGTTKIQILIDLTLFIVLILSRFIFSYFFF